jgi:glyoxylase-like metal-dependent hydrolase (beta-lactamase superfamily II)
MPLQMTQPAPGIRRFDDVYTNSYLLEEGGRLTLVDAGLPGDWKTFGAQLATLGYGIEAIDAVLLTHHHPDHVGNAERLRSAGSRVFTHPADADFVTGRKKLPIGPQLKAIMNPWYAGYLTKLLLKGITRVAPVAELEDMADGEVLEVPGSPRVVHVPGHTAGSCALLLERDSVLLSGDALVTTDVAKGKVQGPQIIRGPVTEDAAGAIESLDILAATEAKVVLPGHGDPWVDGVGEAVAIARST